MKHEFSAMPDAMKGIATYGFSWMEFVASIPSPLFVVTTYKSNGLPNACLQSWATFFSGDEGRYYCLMASVNREKHMYRSIRETGSLAVNFPSAEIYPACMETIRNNGFDDDEITRSGLTAERATAVNAPRIRECFLTLECRYCWEREQSPGSAAVVLCAEVVNVAMEADSFDETVRGRYGAAGYLYNIHHPTHPLTGREEPDRAATLTKGGGQ